MGTRLLSEYLIKKYNPHLRYVRVHTSGKTRRPYMHGTMICNCRIKTSKR
ncbi:hypothetical protein [Cohnella silvisoli]|uniref:Uncharacterized protein n=1 Tax=Cohnella silvisoli TaxID=2873699 RepID=A0ABV1KQR1_9BACL|nr:hypothetical protein [Cohnella silvisoli]